MYMYCSPPVHKHVHAYIVHVLVCMCAYTYMYITTMVVRCGSLVSGSSDLLATLLVAVKSKHRVNTACRVVYHVWHVDCSAGCGMCKPVSPRKFPDSRSLCYEICPI